MSCDVGKAVEGLENELWCRWSDLRVGKWGSASFSNPYIASPTSQLILQPFRPFTYVTARSTTLSMLHLGHSSFSNPSAASSTSQLILQTFRCFTYVTAHSTTLPPLHLRHNSFYNPSVASPTSQALHVREPPMNRGWKNRLCWTSSLQQVY